LWQNALVSFPCTPVSYILTAHKMVDGHIWNWEIQYNVTGYFTLIIICALVSKLKNMNIFAVEIKSQPTRF
jgi:hypothetical protein